MLGEQPSQLVLDRLVGFGHRRQVGFRLDPKIASAEPLQRDRVGSVGELECEGKVRAHRALTLPSRNQLEAMSRNVGLATVIRTGFDQLMYGMTSWLRFRPRTR